LGGKRPRHYVELVDAPGQQPQPAARYASVALNLPLRQEFTYRLPAGAELRPGHRVRVPFRGGQQVGIVTGVDVALDFEAAKVREVSEVVDASLALPAALLELARWIAREYACSLGEALNSMLPRVARQRGAARIPCLELAVTAAVAEAAILELEDRYAGQARVLRLLLEHGRLPQFEVLRRTGTSDSPWQTLRRHGTIRRVLIEEEARPLPIPHQETVVRHALNADQQAAVDAILRPVPRREHRVFLLHGVTGSGKTEVYLHALEAVRRSGRGGIVLVPEIALTPQTVGRFAAWFPDVAVLHSGLTDAERGRQWRQLLSGRAHVAVGARSALFAPLADVGLIVLDEEQEGTFKQDSRPRYHAREAAIARARIENAVVVLGSATPTLESYGRSRRGVYELLALPKRAGKGTLPAVLVEDLRREEKDSNVEGVVLSRRLRILIEEKLAAREQVILLQNRRGYSPVLICPGCGTPVRCRRCEVSMTFHRKRGRLLCHYCCAEQRRPEICPLCSHAGYHELGAGTERVAAAVNKLWPQSVVARMDADSMAERGAHERVLAAFRSRQIDILVGTQMVAKGHDFPDVTLVGVVSADTGLFVPDFRAAERTFQLLYQVAGRTGRGERPGSVVLQTLCPENYAVRAAAALDYEGFVQQELRFRREAGYPPFVRLIRVLGEGRREPALAAEMRRAAGLVPRGESIRVLGPAPTVVPRIKDRFRLQLLVKCGTAGAFQAAVDALRDVEQRTTTTLRLTLDVDPGSML
jgi:primosomal protein N' (replication factor Y)